MLPDAVCTIAVTIDVSLPCVQLRKFPRVQQPKQLETVWLLAIISPQLTSKSLQPGLKIRRKFAHDNVICLGFLVSHALPLCLLFRELRWTPT